MFGLQSEYCVRSTIKGALKSGGFKIKLLSGAHSTFDENGKTAAQIEREVEEELSKDGVQVIPWESWKP